MKREAVISLSAAFLAATLFASQCVQAKTESGSTSMDESTKSVSGAQHEAGLMVPAQAVLKTRIDARALHAGDTFQAALTRKAALKNGPELPKDTVLTGTVAIDRAENNGPSQLVLRFTQAKLKDGRSLPIKAMIAGVFGKTVNAAAGSYTWEEHSLQIEQSGVIRGADLHSEIASEDSGVLVSGNMNNLTLSPGTTLELALAYKENR